MKANLVCGLVGAALSVVLAQDPAPSPRVAALRFSMKERLLSPSDSPLVLVREASPFGSERYSPDDAPLMMRALGTHSRLAGADSAFQCWPGRNACSVIGKYPVIVVSNPSTEGGVVVVRVQRYETVQSPEGSRDAGSVLAIEVSKSEAGWVGVRLITRATGVSGVLRPPPRDRD